jgi:A nuclease family of the HNH/ENDO VII superfamily with conserved AHH
VRRGAAGALAPPEGPAKPTGGLDDPARAHLEEGGLQEFVKRPPPRVSETVEGVSRGALKGRMVRDGQRPTWARTDGDWNPHHLLPVSQEHHPVLETLRAHGGWDNNATRNGFALPTRPDIPGAEGLPVHQATPEVFRRAGRPVPDPQTMRDLQGHPVWNQKVKERLDALEPYMDRPDELRRKVEELIDDLRHDIETSVANGKPVLF